MLIEEQIKIARLIASGTPREDAINEVAPTSSIEKSGQTIDVDAETVQDKAKSRLDKVRQAARIARKKTQRGISKGGAIVKSAAGKLVKKDDKPTTNVNVVLPKDKEGVGLQKVDSAEAGASATQKAAGNVAKLGAKGIKKLAGMRLRKEEFIQEVEDKKDTKK